MSEKKSTFSVTCSRLSQFLKERRNMGELEVLDVASKPQEQIKGLFRTATPSPMSFLPGVNVSAGQQTESGQNAVKPVDLFPQQTCFDCAEKKKVTEEPEKPQLTIFYDGKVLVFDNFPPEKANELMKLVATGSVEAADWQRPASRPSTPAAAQSDPSELPMPIARRASLHRFFEKRKDRITSKAPYQVNCNSSPIAESSKAEQSWLGLGQEISNSSSNS